MANAGQSMILGRRVAGHYAAVVSSVVRLVDYIEGVSMQDSSIRNREREMRRAANQLNIELPNREKSNHDG